MVCGYKRIITAALSTILMIISSAAQCGPIYDMFEKLARENGFKFGRTESYVSFTFGQVISREPYKFTEAFRMLRDEESNKLLQRITYKMTEDGDKPSLTFGYYWYSCNHRRLKYVVDTSYEDVIRNQTGGYDVLGNKIPTEYRAFDEGELASISTALPLYDLDTKSVMVMGEKKNLEFYEHERLSEFLVDHCPKRQPK